MKLEKKVICLDILKYFFFIASNRLLECLNPLLLVVQQHLVGS